MNVLSGIELCYSKHFIHTTLPIHHFPEDFVALFDDECELGFAWSAGCFLHDDSCIMEGCNGVLHIRFVTAHFTGFWLVLLPTVSGLKSQLMISHFNSHIFIYV